MAALSPSNYSVLTTLASQLALRSPWSQASGDAASDVNGWLAYALGDAVTSPQIVALRESVRVAIGSNVTPDAKRMFEYYRALLDGTLPLPISAPVLMWIDGRSAAYSDTAGTVVTPDYSGRVRRTNYGSPAVGNAQGASTVLSPYREPGAINFEVGAGGAGSYLAAPVAANCLQSAVTIAVCFTVRDKPEGSVQNLVSNGTQLKVMTFSANLPAVNYNNTAGFWAPAPAVPLGSQCTLIVRLSTAQIRMTVIVDGVRNDYTTTVTVNATTLPLATWFVGWDGTSSGDERLHGAISQAVVVGRAITDAENNALATWGVGNSAPHYCPNAAALVTICGDSIARAGVGFYGVPLASSYAMIAQQTLNATQPVNLINGAISGDTIANQQNNVFTPILLPFYSGARSRNVFFQAAGTNDMAAGNRDGPTTLALSYSLMDAAKAAGFRVVGYTILKRVGTGHDAAFEAARGYYNSHLLSEFAARGYYAVADCGAIAEAQDPTNLTYFSDGIHPTTALHSIIAPVVASALQSAIT